MNQINIPICSINAGLGMTIGHLLPCKSSPLLQLYEIKNFTGITKVHRVRINNSKLQDIYLSLNTTEYSEYSEISNNIFSSVWIGGGGVILMRLEAIPNKQQFYFGLMKK